MAVGIYCDVHIPKAIVVGLRSRGVTVLTAQEDEAARMTDTALLNRATLLDMMLFTYDDDLLVDANRRDRVGGRFSGIIYARALNAPIGPSIEDLEIIAKSLDASDLQNRIEYIPF